MSDNVGNVMKTAAVTKTRCVSFIGDHDAVRNSEGVKEEYLLYAIKALLI